jgi:hypothetical protein
MKEFNDAREIVLYILGEKDNVRQSMLFGMYKSRLSPAQVKFIEDKLKINHPIDPGILSFVKEHRDEGWRWADK